MTKITICASIAWSFVIASLVLCSYWASKDETQYLGIPIWADGSAHKFSWHPVLMVCGFFFSQVFAMTSFAVGDDLSKDCNLGTKADLPAFWSHIFFQVAALATVIPGLIAIFQYKNEQLLPNLVTLHSWLGIFAVTTFFANVALAIYVGKLNCILKFCGPSPAIPDPSVPTTTNPVSETPSVPSPTTLQETNPTNPPLTLTASYFLPFEKAKMAEVHKQLGMLTLVFTVLAIMTGIMNEQADEGGCLYQESSGQPISITHPDTNPSSNYPSLPDGCKISNGLGICVLLATFGVLQTYALHISFLQKQALEKEKAKKLGTLNEIERGLSPNADSDERPGQILSITGMGADVVPSPSTPVGGGKD